ncbi:hypothetical protein REPUB_Repub07fG0174800 [Reevesia pubescens]
MAKWSVVMLVLPLLVARASSRNLPRLSELLGVEVKLENDCIGEEVVKLVDEIPNEGVLLNENVRFYKEEEKNDPELTTKVTSLAELDYLVGAVANPKKPFAAIVGSSKAQGNSFGSSLAEEDKLDLATSLLKKATAKRVSSLLPTDVIIADKFDDDGNCKVVPASQIAGSGIDLGYRT